MTELATRRLKMRPLTAPDAQRLTSLARDWDVARMASSIPFPLPEICIEGFILLMEARRGRGSDHVFGIEFGSEGLIGVVGAHERGSEIEIGYWIGRPYWGKGLATEAAIAISDYASRLGRGVVVARCFSDNPASGRVLEKAGFVCTGETLGYSLARRERAPMKVMRREMLLAA